MVAIRIGGISLATLEDDAFAQVLAAAEATGGAAAYPVLFAMPDEHEAVEPLGLLDELVRLAGTDDGQAVAMLIGTLRDDLMTAVAAAGEG